MIDLRQSNIYELNEGIFGVEDTKRKYCSIGMLKCSGIFIFLSGLSVIGIKLRTPCPLDGSV
jgi:hypothetical protein